LKTRIFIDFWNFQLNWNGRAPSGVRLDWTVVPPVFLAEAEKLLSKVGQGGSATLEETLVHASVNPSTEVGRNLRGWLTSFLDHQPSFNVRIRERKSRKFIVHCNSCDQEHSTCPACGADLRRAAEKGVDSAIVTDLLSLAVESAFDLAVLVSSDADLIPAVEWVQDRGLKVINATWSGYGYELARTCWGSFPIDSVIGPLSRTS
jgi:uncharacterized LabA/DUF88 family protein